MFNGSVNDRVDLSGLGRFHRCLQAAQRKKAADAARLPRRDILRLDVDRHQDLLRRIVGDRPAGLDRRQLQINAGDLCPFGQHRLGADDDEVEVRPIRVVGQKLGRDFRTHPRRIAEKKPDAGC